MASGFAGLLQGIAGPVVKKALSALGIGVVSYAAINAALSAVTAAVQSSYGSMTGDVAGILGLAGIGQAIGILLGAMAARISYAQLSKLQILAK